MTDPQQRGDLAPSEREMTSADLTAHDPEHGQEGHDDETEPATDAEGVNGTEVDDTELAASTGVPDETELPDERAGEGA
ncbi:hypothetical protein P5G50_03800 [Leifsonia sp. F6_8S_P_1B]|uniref:Autophagy-related protein 2 n=1 Tax=Leifsonia williamsii TaxID=3035919 RepID=A0ABT8K804_9MICO|nr:hypothetical protein [Leifsonia williamsii]MDN4613569.1 hypothetical protein [Leifsonia williamsii]